MWSSTSRGLSQHAAAAPFVALVVYLTVKSRTRPAVVGPLGLVTTGMMTFGGTALTMGGSIGQIIAGLGALNGALILEKASLVASTAAKGIAAAATGVWTGAQWLLNAALTAHPIGSVIVVIAALVAHGVRLTRAEPPQTTLEDLYFAVRTKRSIADDGGRQLTPSDDAPLTDRHRQVAALTGWPGAEGDHR